MPIIFHLYLFQGKDVGCVKPFSDALKNLKKHVNADGKKTIDSTIAELEKYKKCVEDSDVKCILKHLAGSVGIADMDKLEKDVEPKLRPVFEAIKILNKGVIDRLKKLPQAEAKKIAKAEVCRVRKQKACLINNAL